MADFLVIYHGSGNQGATHEEQLARMEAWLKWLGGVGGNVKDAGHPAARAWTVSKDGTSEDAGANPVSGYTVLTAGSMQAALEMVTGCPHLAEGGSIELVELMPEGHASIR